MRRRRPASRTKAAAGDRERERERAACGAAGVVRGGAWGEMQRLVGNGALACRGEVRGGDGGGEDVGRRTQRRREALRRARGEKEARARARARVCEIETELLGGERMRSWWKGRYPPISIRTLRNGFGVCVDGWLVSLVLSARDLSAASSCFLGSRARSSFRGGERRVRCEYVSAHMCSLVCARRMAF